MIKVEAVLVNAVMPDSILVSIVGIGRGVGVVGGGTYVDKHGVNSIGKEER